MHRLCAQVLYHLCIPVKLSCAGVSIHLIRSHLLVWAASMQRKVNIRLFAMYGAVHLCECALTK